MTTGSIQILIVEDDPEFLDILREYLLSVDPSLAISSVNAAKEALYELRTKSYDIVISDYLLSDRGTGLWVWDTYGKKHPEVSFLLISGVPVESLMEMTMGRELCPRFLSKPFSSAEFEQTVREMIGEVRARRNHAVFKKLPNT